MRVSVLRLWISVGFAVLAMELALLVFVLVRNRDDMKEMKKNVADLKEESERVKRELQSLHAEQKRARRPVTAEKTEIPIEKEVGVGTASDPAEFVRLYGDAVARADRAEEDRLARKLHELRDRAAQSLMAAIGPESSVTKKRGFYALLGDFALPEVLGFLQQRIGDEKERTLRIEIAEALARQPDNSSVGVLDRALRGETDPGTRLALMKAVSKIDSDEAAQILYFTYQQPAEGEKLQVLKTLSEMSRVKFKSFFQEILTTSKSADERVVAAKALGNLRDSSSLPVLETAKNSDPEEPVRTEAERAISRITGK